MATLVSFHAHPDDETVLTGGTLAAAAAAGHRTVLVVATRGECGDVVPGTLTPGERLADRRAAELTDAAEILGLSRVEFLGYRDSGMSGEPTNSAPNAFCHAEIGEAAHRLAEILRQERADVLTTYDRHGGYGHPDHVAVHRVGAAAAGIAGTPQVYEATMDRDRVRRGARALRLLRLHPPGHLIDPGFGVPRNTITTVVDVSRQLDRKRAAMAAHRSQIGPDSPLLALPKPLFAIAFGREWFVRADRAVPARSERGLAGL